MEEDGSRAMRLVLAGLIAAIIVGGTVDLVLDRPTSWTGAHTVYELLLIAGAVAVAVWLWTNWKRAAESAAALRQSLAERQAERRRLAPAGGSGPRRTGSRRARSVRSLGADAG